MLIAIGPAFGLVVVGVGAIVVLSGQGADANSVYPQKLTASLAPVLLANRALSSRLQSLSGIPLHRRRHGEGPMAAAGRLGSCRAPR